MEASFWRRLWTCRQTEYWMNEWICNLALSVKQRNPDFYVCMKMIVGWWSGYCLCGAESGMWLHWRKRKLILQLGSRIRTCRKGTNLVGAESCIAFCESVEDVGKGAGTSREVGSVYTGTRWVCGCHHRLQAKQFLLLSFIEQGWTNCCSQCNQYGFSQFPTQMCSSVPLALRVLPISSFDLLDLLVLDD